MTDPARSTPFRYGLAALAVSLAAAARLALHPVLGSRQPFVSLYLAVIVTAWYAGRGPALVALVLGMLGTSWLVLEPRGALSIDSSAYKVGLLLYGGVGYAVIAVIESLRRSQEQLRITLASIGDAVISTDAGGCVTFLNPVRFNNPTGHVTATIDPFMLDRTVFSAGGFGAAYGNALSGLVRMIHAAYNVLADPDARRIYDERLQREAAAADAELQSLLDTQPVARFTRIQRVPEPLHFAISALAA